MLGSMDGEQGGVYVEYVSPIVSCYSLTYRENCIWGGRGGGGGEGKERYVRLN